jgi:hypothetical protein
MKKTFSSPVLFLWIALGSFGGSISKTALAQDPSSMDIAQARELFNQGLALREKGDKAGAVEKLRGANALAHTPLTGLELARAYIAVGKLVEAREACLSVARMPVQAAETVRSRNARADSAKLADELHARIPNVSVKITGVAADSVAVTIDGAVVATEALDAPRWVDPGIHDIVARSTSGGVAEAKVALTEGESREVELKIVFTTPTPAVVPSPAPATVVPPPAAATNPVVTPARVLSLAPTRRARSHVLEWTLIGAGAAVAAAGTVLIVVEANRVADANRVHDPSEYNSATSGWTAGWVGILVGGAAVAAGGIVLASFGASTHESHASTWVRLGAGGAALGGTW